jgi:hypothetical protein
MRVPSQPAVVRHALHRDAPVVCARCKRSVPRKARQQKYCSARCRELAKERSRKAFLGQDTGAPPNPPKKINGFKSLPVPKTGSSISPKVPRRVIEVEVFGGREWQQTTSSGGVACEVSTLRPRALRNGDGR